MVKSIYDMPPEEAKKHIEKAVNREQIARIYKALTGKEIKFGKPRKSSASARRSSSAPKPQPEKTYKVTHVVTLPSGKEVPVAKTEKGTYLYETPSGEIKEIKPSEKAPYKTEWVMGRIAKAYGARSYGWVLAEKYSEFKAAQEYAKIKRGEKEAWVTPEGELVISKGAPFGQRKEVAIKRGYVKLPPEQISFGKGSIIGTYEREMPVITKPSGEAKIEKIGGGTVSILKKKGKEYEPLPLLTGGQFTRSPTETETLLSASPLIRSAIEEHKERMKKQEEWLKELEYIRLEEKAKKTFREAPIHHKIGLAASQTVWAGIPFVGLSISEKLGIAKPGTAETYYWREMGKILEEAEKKKQERDKRKSIFEKVAVGTTQFVEEFGKGLLSEKSIPGTFVTSVGAGIAFKTVGASILSSKAGKLALAGATTIYGGSVAYELGEKYTQGKLEEVPEVVLRTAMQVGGVYAGAKMVETKIYKPVGAPIITGKPTKTGMRYRIWRMLKNSEGKVKEEVYDVKVNTKKGTYVVRKIYDNKPVNKVVAQGKIAEEQKLIRYGKLTKSEIATARGFEISEYPYKKFTVFESLTEAVRMKKTPETFLTVRAKSVEVSAYPKKGLKPKALSKPIEITAKGVIGAKPKGIPKEPAYLVTTKGTWGKETSTLYSTLGEALIKITKTPTVKPAPTIVGASPVVGLERILPKPKKVVGIKESIKAREKELKKPKIFVLPLISSLKPISEVKKEKSKRKLKKKLPFEIPIELPLKPIKEKLKEKLIGTVRVKPRIKEITPKQSQIRSPRLVQLVSERGLGEIKRVTKPVIGLKFGEEQIRRRKPMEIFSLGFLYKTKLKTGTIPPIPSIPEFELKSGKPISIFLPTGKFPVMKGKREGRKRKILYWEVHHQIPNIVEVLRIKK